MRRLLILFEPVEILNIPPKILFIFSLKINLMLFLLCIVERIRLKNNFVAIFNDRFACDKYSEGAFIGVVNS